MNKGDLKANLKETDKIYGRCNNPNRQFTKVERDICEAKVRAAGPDGEIGERIKDQKKSFQTKEKIRTVFAVIGVKINHAAIIDLPA